MPKFGDGVIVSANEAVIQQLAKQRPTIEILGDDIFPDGGPAPKSVIEIFGSPNSGKTLLLSECMARCLPPTYFGGRYCDIVFIDLDHKFSTTYFINTLKRIIIKSGEPATAKETDSVVENCLDSMQILKCYSSEEFDLAMDALEDILRSNRDIALIALDNIEAFYWLDAHKKLISVNNHYNRNLKRLTNLAHKHNLTCIYTVDSNYLESDSLSATTTTKIIPPTHKIELQMLTPGNIYMKLFGYGSKKLTIDDEGLNLSSDWLCFD